METLESDCSCTGSCSSCSCKDCNCNNTEENTSTSSKTNVGNVINNDEQVNEKPSVAPVKSKWDKRTCCYYCKQLVLKLTRHLLRKHGGEDKVREFTSLPNKSKRRLEIISELRKRGNFFYNHDCLENQTGNLIVKRRPTKLSVDGSNFLPCSNCLGYYSKKTLFLHVKKCCKNLQQGSRVQKLAKALLPRDPGASLHLRNKILPELKDDEIGKAILSDNLILRFGSDLALKFCRDDHLSGHVRQRMRELGRLLIEIRKIDQSFQCLAEIFHPKQCKLAIEALTKLVNFSAETGDCGKPSMIMKLRTSIRMCAEILKSLAIENEDESEKNSLDNFITVMNLKLKRLCSLAKQTLEATKWNKPLELPTSMEVIKFNKYLDEQEDIFYTNLVHQFSFETWNKLSKIVLVKIIIFNRRRVGEGQMMKIEEFERRHTVTEDSDVYKTLSDMEKKIVNNYLRIQVRGKLRRGVPILISLKQVDIINLMLQYRVEAGVDQNNPFVFGRKTRSFIRATDAIRLLSSEAKITHSNNMRSTKLRKQIATQAQVLNLKDNELDDLANTMGHDIRVHREFYRLPDHALQIAKTGKILLAMDQGILLENQGKGLDDIEVNINEVNTEAEEQIRTKNQENTNNNRIDDVSSKPNKTKDLNNIVNLVSPKAAKFGCDVADEISPDPHYTEKPEHLQNPDSMNTAEINMKKYPLRKRNDKTLNTFSITNSSPIYDSDDNIKDPDYYISPKKSINELSNSQRINNQSKCNKHSYEQNTNKQKEERHQDLDHTINEDSLCTPKKKSKSDIRKDIVPSSSDEDCYSYVTSTNRGKTRWLTPEKQAIKRHFADYLLRLQVPGKAECLKVISLEPVLKSRRWDSIKTWIHNTNKTTLSRKKRNEKQLKSTVRKLDL